VTVGVGVRVTVEVLVGVSVTVGVGVSEGVGVSVGVSVLVGVKVSVGVRVLVGVRDGPMPPPPMLTTRAVRKASSNPLRSACNVTEGQMELTNGMINGCSYVTLTATRAFS